MEEKFLQIDGNKVRYLESGDSDQTLVLVHGLGASAERWNNVIPIFSKNFKVVVPDLIGFGYSDKPLLDYTPEFFSDFLHKFFIESAVEEPFIVGSSLGGQISVEYASTRPSDIKKLVLVSPAGMMKQSTPALDAYIMAALYPNEQNAKNAFEMMEGSGNTVHSDIVSGFIERMHLPNAKLAFMSTILGLKNSDPLTEKLQKISAPTLVIWGSDDPVIPITYADSFVSSVQDCMFFRMDGCGHTPYVQEPKIFSSRVTDFLNEC